MNTNNGMILWVMGGAGVFLLYAAYKNRNPSALLADHINGTNTAQPISNFTGGTKQVPQVTTPDGKTYNTAPGDGGYATGDPPSSKLHDGYNSGGGYLAGWSTQYDSVFDEYRLIDSQGRMIGVVPDKYKNNPSLYIPAVNA